MRRALAVVTLVFVAAGVALAGCTSLRRITGTGGGTDLSRALARVAATDATRKRVRYEATGKLTNLAGDKIATGFGTLLLAATDLGSTLLMMDIDLGPETLIEVAGIAPLDAEYAISAGLSPNTVAVLAGGQQSDRVGIALTASGWTRKDDRYVAPDFHRAISGPNGAQAVLYEVSLAQVRPDGADVVFGRPMADLGAAGHPSGKTLADDQPTRALADCLGDVVVAQMVTDYKFRLDRVPRAAPATPSTVPMDKLTEVAVGVRTPKSASDTPRAVVCTAWGDQPAANAYAAAVPTVLASGLSPAVGQPYAHGLHNPETRIVGGSAHIVEWSADEDDHDQPGLVLAMLQRLDVPGLF